MDDMDDPDEAEMPQLLGGVPALLRSARHHADLSQRELALRAGVSNGLVGNLEAGRTEAPTLRTLVRLLAAAGCRLVALDSNGAPLPVRSNDSVVDAGGRAYPAHLDVRFVLTEGDWWYGIYLTDLRPLPLFTTDRRGLRRDMRRSSAAEKPSNTPRPPEVSGEDHPAG